MKPIFGWIKNFLKLGPEKVIDLNLWLNYQTPPLVKIEPQMLFDGGKEITIGKYIYWYIPPIKEYADQIIEGESFYQYLKKLDPLLKGVVRWMKKDLGLPDLKDHNGLSFLEEGTVISQHSAQLIIAKANHDKYQMLLVMDVPGKTLVPRSLVEIITLIKILEDERKNLNSDMPDHLDFFKQSGAIVGYFHDKEGNVYCFILKK